MLKKVLQMCCVMAIAIMLPSSFPRHYILTEAEAPTQWEDSSVVNIIDHYALLYHQNPALLKKVAECESQNQTDLIGDGGRAFSVFQFHKETFEQWSKEFGEDLDYKSYHDNIKLAAWSFSQGEDYRRAWTTYVAIKNGGTYAFYSRQLKKYFVVHCAL